MLWRMQCQGSFSDAHHKDLEVLEDLKVLEDLDDLEVLEDEFWDNADEVNLKY